MCMIGQAVLFSKGAHYKVEVIHSVAVENQGNVFVAGTTINSEFPGTPGCHDDSITGYEGFVTKFSADPWHHAGIDILSVAIVTMKSTPWLSTGTIKYTWQAIPGLRVLMSKSFRSPPEPLNAIGPVTPKTGCGGPSGQQPEHRTGRNDFRGRFGRWYKQI